MLMLFMLLLLLIKMAIMMREIRIDIDKVWVIIMVTTISRR